MLHATLHRIMSKMKLKIRFCDKATQCWSTRDEVIQCVLCVLNSETNECFSKCL